MAKRIPKNLEEKMESIGTFIEAIIQDETDPALVCAVLAGNLDKWATDNGYDAFKLATSMALAIKCKHDSEEEEE